MPSPCSGGRHATVREVALFVLHNFVPILLLLTSLLSWQDASGPMRVAFPLSLCLLVPLIAVPKRRTLAALTNLSPTDGRAQPVAADRRVKIGVSAFYIPELDEQILEEIARRMRIGSDELLAAVLYSFDQLDEPTRAHVVWDFLRSGDNE